MPFVDYLPLIGSILGILGILWILLLWVRWIYDKRREERLVFLQVILPKKESRDEKEVDTEEKGRDFKEVIGVMDHFYQSVHGMYDSTWGRLFRGQPYFSLEYAALAKQIIFFVVAPREIVQFIEKQVTSYYPDAIIDEVEDYNIFTPKSVVVGRSLIASKNHVSTFKTYQQLKSDPLNSVANAFSKLEVEEGAAIQIILRPVKNSWQKKLQKHASDFLNPKKKGISILNPLTWIWALMDLFSPNQDGTAGPKEDSPTGERVSQAVEEYSKQLEEKAAYPGFHAVVRVVASANSQPRAQSILDTIAASFAQFNDIRGNTFTRSSLESRRGVVRRFIRRSGRRSVREWFRFKRLLLGTLEIASFYHFPNIKYNRIENIKWQMFKVAPAPTDMPESGLYMGTNTFRGEKRKVYIDGEDRFRHFYIIGQTGTGKSNVLQVMARQDLHSGQGMCVMDPHGSLAKDLLPYIPRERADDVIYFNPADTERPMGLNMLEAETPEEKDFVALEAMNMMVKMFGNEVFGPRIQDYFRNGCLTLMDDEDEGGAITDIVRLFTDDEWQKYKVTKVKNPIVRSFWEHQMAQTGAREKQEMIPYFAAKFGQFTTNTLVRNILGQTKSAFDVSKCMAEGKILMMNLSKGLIGDINSNLLGMIIVNKIQVAAMRRERESKESRKDFFLYIDEFQNFVTQSIESILSEARKYRLGLVLAHQYLGQLEKDDKLSGGVSLKGAIFGNVGTKIFYRIGAQDAETCAKEMAPVFSEQDMLNMGFLRACMRLCIEGQASRPFTLEVPRAWEDNTYPKDEQAAEAYIQLSRLKYGRQKEFVDREILRRIGA
ncbi:hypothetical protein COU77_00870 [Candidatus Peregrinibacteria bacterium CG10_big_fil_rev_8_21_14_0_10_49_16]|nr:MAG: hypothetical protein COW95_03690 [Candidatus Peregrinibacteria bacterium CG22_combo_CG10-13_8_21_14_all_49_11]PIR52339.1 MAG: hypothetical protein COU77_00870 [Candidatus Peregrinibacteria bacterium CG10_big_fil_rev_8_21_14_0_10_49_16]